MVTAQMKEHQLTLDDVRSLCRGELSNILTFLAQRMRPQDEVLRIRKNLQLRQHGSNTATTALIQKLEAQKSQFQALVNEEDDKLSKVQAEIGHLRREIARTQAGCTEQKNVLGAHGREVTAYHAWLALSRLENKQLLACASALDAMSAQWEQRASTSGTATFVAGPEGALTAVHDEQLRRAVAQIMQSSRPGDVGKAGLTEEATGSWEEANNDQANSWCTPPELVLAATTSMHATANALAEEVRHFPTSSLAAECKYEYDGVKWVDQGRSAGGSGKDRRHRRQHPVKDLAQQLHAKAETLSLEAEQAINDASSFQRSLDELDQATQRAHLADPLVQSDATKRELIQKLQKQERMALAGQRASSLLLEWIERLHGWEVSEQMRVGEIQERKARVASFHAMQEEMTNHLHGNLIGSATLSQDLRDFEANLSGQTALRTACQKCLQSCHLPLSSDSGKEAQEMHQFIRGAHIMDALLEGQGKRQQRADCAQALGQRTPPQLLQQLSAVQHLQHESAHLSAILAAHSPSKEEDSSSSSEMQTSEGMPNLASGTAEAQTAFLEAIRERDGQSLRTSVPILKEAHSSAQKTLADADNIKVYAEHWWTQPGAFVLPEHRVNGMNLKEWTAKVRSLQAKLQSQGQ
jgi:hypothetical protein